MSENRVKLIELELYTLLIHTSVQNTNRKGAPTPLLLESGQIGSGKKFEILC